MYSLRERPTGKKVKNSFCFVLNIYQDVTHVTTYIFQGRFKNMDFRSVEIVDHKKRFLDFLQGPYYSPPCTIP